MGVDPEADALTERLRYVLCVAADSGFTHTPRIVCALRINFNVLVFARRHDFTSQELQAGCKLGRIADIQVGRRQPLTKHL